MGVWSSRYVFDMSEVTARNLPLVSSYLNTDVKSSRPGTILFIRRRLFHSYNFTFPKNVWIFAQFRATGPFRSNTSKNYKPVNDIN